MADEDEFSVVLCAACQHSKFLHDSNNGACFADPKKRNAPSGTTYSDATREARKKLRVECWCPAFTLDTKKGSDLILQHGDLNAVRRGVNEALDRRDFDAARGLKSKYVREAPGEERDNVWLGDVTLRLALWDASMSPPAYHDKKEKVTREGSAGDSEVWKDFHTGFFNLASEEAQIVRATMKDDFLRARCTYKRDEIVYHDRGNPENGPFCLLNMPECGIWSISSGVSENFQERFRTLASRAALALGCPVGSEPEDHWLHSLFRDLIENRSKLLFAEENGESGMILRVCETSATFCARIERKALKPSNATVGKSNHPEFEHSEDYCSVTYRGQHYSLTKSAADVIRLLHEAHRDNKAGLSSRAIKKRLTCGRVWDQFRQRDGRALREALIRKTSRDFFCLNLSLEGDAQEN